MSGMPEAAGEEATGERLMPDAQHGELVHAEHLARYLLAAGLSTGGRVLDVACGEGYGTDMLARAGAEAVVGVDVDGATIERAAKRYSGDFRRADITALPFEDASFDLVVSFETIEHVVDADAALSELERVLAPDGLLLISTPNTHEYLVDNEFHTREFSHEEFAALLEARFASVRLLYQHNWLLSAVIDEPALREGTGAERLDIDVRKTVALEPGRELYTLALCGERTDVGLAQVGVAAGTDEAHQLARRLIDAEETVRLWHGEYEKAAETAKMWHDVYKEEEQRTEAAWAYARQMNESLSWRITKPLRIPAKLRERRGR